MDSPNPTRKDNGAGNPEVDTLILKYDRVRDHLEVGGHCNSLLLMLDMLGRATRVLESQWRAEQALNLREKLAEQAQAEAIAAALRKGA